MSKETAIQQKTAAEIELLQKQAEAQFALTPMGQALKQFEICQRMAQLFSKTSIVPDTYRDNMPNCAVAIDMAMRMNMPPVMVMQNLYVVHGNPAWSSKFLIACIKACGRFTTLEYEYKQGVAEDSDEYGCRCVAYERVDTKRERPLYGTWITWKMVKDEGWLKKNGSKWATMPEQMFRYRAAAFWQRTYAPEISMGIGTVEEAYDTAGTKERTAPIDVAYEEVKEPEPEAITEAQRNAAYEALQDAVTSEEVKAVKAAHKAVYDSDEAFRDALIDYYQGLVSCEKEMQQVEAQRADSPEPVRPKQVRSSLRKTEQ